MGKLSRQQERPDRISLPADRHGLETLEPWTSRNIRPLIKAVCKLPNGSSRNLLPLGSIKKVTQECRRHVLSVDLRH